MEGSTSGFQNQPNSNPTKTAASKNNPTDKNNYTNKQNNIINSQPASNFARDPNPNQVLNQASENSPNINSLPTTSKSGDSTKPVNMPSHLQTNVPSNANTTNSNKLTNNNKPLNTTLSNLTQENSTTNQKTDDLKTKNEQQFQPMYGELKTPNYSGHLENPDISDRVEIQSQKKKTNLPLIIGISLMILVGLASIIYTFVTYFNVKNNIDGSIIELLFKDIIP